MSIIKTKRHAMPIHIKKPHGYLTHRDAIWATIRELRTEFTTRDIEHKCSVDHSTIKNLCRGLEVAGYLKVTGKLEQQHKQGQSRAIHAYTCNLYTLVNDIGVNTPRISKTGEVITQGDSRKQMWNTLKVLRQFTLKELIAHASTEECEIKETTAKEYILALRRGGYILIAQPARGKRCTIYRLLRHTGPKPPQIQRTKQVFDPNLREIVWQRVEGDQLDTPVCCNIGDEA